MIRVEVVDAAGFAPYAAQVHAFEPLITYPIEGGADRFWIDHGPAYTGFFRGLGDSWFMLLLDGDRVLGIGAAAFRSVVGPGGREVPVLYAGDLKLHPEARGRGLARTMFVHGLRGLLTDRRAPTWRFVFGAAMQGAEGDVTRSFKGRLHPGHLSRPYARLAVYFAPPRALHDLVGEGPRAPGGGIDLGVRRARPIAESTTGRKDLRLVSTGRPWPLVHLPDAPDAWDGGVGTWLRRAARALGDDDVACFAIDERLEAQRAWLAEQGVATATRAVVYGMPHPYAIFSDWRGVPWIHLPTSEI